MHNYVQEETISPKGKIEAWQSKNDYFLFFAIDPPGFFPLSLYFFHAIEEQKRNFTRVGRSALAVKIEEPIPG